MKFVLVVLWYYGYKGGAAMHSIEFSTLDACQKAQPQIALEEGRHHMEYGQYSVSCQYRAMYDAAPKVKL